MTQKYPFFLALTFFLNGGITKSCNYPRPLPTSHNFVATTHDHPRAVIISSPPRTTRSHDFAAPAHDQPLIHQRHPRLRTLPKNDLIESNFSKTLHRLTEHAFWFSNLSTVFFESSQ